MMKKVLVTGANGQLGKTIQELYNNNTMDLDFFFVSKQDLDITNKKQIDNFFKSYNFDFCINCAAYTNVEQAEKTPEIAFNVNAEGVKNLAHKCDEKDIFLIHISTDYVFDGEKQGAYSIADQTNPINEYGKSKLLGEQYIQNILTKYCIIRTSWLYSKQYDHNFYRSILKKAKEGRELFITTNQKGCPTNTENLVHYIVNLVSVKPDNLGLKHFCDDEVTTWYGFAKKILKENKLLDKTKLVKVDNYCTFASRPKNSVLNRQ